MTVGELGATPLRGAERLSSELEECGWATCAGAASPGWCSVLRDEAEALFEAGLLLPSLNRMATARSAKEHTSTVPAPAASGVVCAKRGVYEIELVANGELACAGDALLALAPVLRAWLREGAPVLLGQLREALPWLQLDKLDQAKLQLNEGCGGCFPLQLHPFPLAPVLVAPEEGKRALFSSVQVLHRVLPCSHRRLALSLWFSAALRPAPAFPSRYPDWVAAAGGADAASLLPFLRGPANARLLTKILLAEEWAQSLRDAFPDGGEGLEAALELHFAESREQAMRVNAPLLALLRETLPLTPA